MSGMLHPHLPRDTRHPRPPVGLAPEITLATGRLHEACGPARRTFALWLAGQRQGPVFWITLSHQQDRTNPDGMAELADPSRFVFLTPRRVEDALWCMEEVLRAGLVPLVVADLPVLPALTPVRRLHLASETGAARGGAPLGLLLTPEDGGAQGVESRWHMAPAHQPKERQWQLERRRARTSPPASWTVKAKAGGGGLVASSCATSPETL